MLVVTANWNITDGSLWRRPLRGLVDRTWAAVQRAALRAGFRHDGCYAPIDRLDIVFAGDTCDLLSSQQWITRDLRPWNRSTRVAAIRRQVAAAAVRRAAPLLRQARQLLADGLMVPAATTQGRPHLRQPVKVPVSITLLAGDRDGFLEAATPDWQQVHWAEQWQGYGWQIEHGQRFGPLHHSQRDQADTPSFSQLLTVGLLARFAAVILDGATRVAGVTADGLRLLAESHPLEVPDLFWQRFLPQAAGGSQDRATRLAKQWKKAVKAWHREAVCSQVQVPCQFDFVGRFAGALEAPSDEGHAASLLADLCGTAGRSPAPDEFAEPAGLLLGHPTEAVQAAAWGEAVASRCLGRPLAVTSDVGLVSGETVDVKLVQPAVPALRPASPRGLAVMGDAGRVEPLDLSRHSPAVAWQPDAAVAAWPQPLRRTGEAA
jgi:hypothetical protein